MTDEPLDVIGVGLGPANLAVAAAFSDMMPDDYWRFIEREAGFSWHPGMKLSSSKLQHSFLKDLATVRDPSSRFTFIRYLFESGKLEDFIELRTFFPSRSEYENYFQWVAEAVGENVSYNTEVTGISVASGAVGNRLLEISTADTRTGRAAVSLARNVIIGVGATPFSPVPIPSASDRVIHSSQFALRWKSSAEPKSYLVVGAGQSAIEIILHLLQTERNCQVVAASRSFLFRSVEENALVNRMFSEGGSQSHFEMPATLRARSMADLRLANCAGAERELVDELYALLYDEGALNTDRLRLCSYHDLINVEDAADLNHARATFETHRVNGPAQVDVSADMIVLATGFTMDGAINLLSGFEDENGQLATRRADYRIAVGGSTAGLYVHTLPGGQFGLSEGNITNLGRRAAVIANSIKTHLPQQRASDRDRHLARAISR